jgi:hypothetical protein
MAQHEYNIIVEQQFNAPLGYCHSDFIPLETMKYVPVSMFLSCTCHIKSPPGLTPQAFARSAPFIKRMIHRINVLAI